jgi:hypothetical protein
MIVSVDKGFDRMTVLDQFLAEIDADVTTGSGDRNFHWAN